MKATSILSPSTGTTPTPDIPITEASQSRIRETPVNGELAQREAGVAFPQNHALTLVRWVDHDSAQPHYWMRTEGLTRLSATA
jgi:hypothetical protein